VKPYGPGGLLVAMDFTIVDTYLKEIGLRRLWFCSREIRGGIEAKIESISACLSTVGSINIWMK
jgi:hypothetical protein